MKKILLTLLSTFLFFSLSKAQTTEESFPQLYKQNGSVVGIVFSVKQAQQIDRDRELLELLKTLTSELETNKVASLEVINVQKQTIEAKNDQIKILEDEILDYKLDIKTRDSLENNLQTDVKYCDEQSKKKDQIISNKDKEITKLKGHRLLLGGTTLLFLVVSIIF